MSLRKILERGGEMTLILKSGTTLSGTATSIEDNVLQLGDTHVLIDEIAAVTLASSRRIRTEAELLTRFGQSEVELLWADPTPSPASLNAALLWFEAIHAALTGLGQTLSSQVRLLRLIETQRGRFAINGTTLEAGFSPDDPPPPVRELQSLLAAIL